jgi:hypothetical protein
LPVDAAGDFEDDVRVAILVDPSDHTLFLFRRGAPMLALRGDATLDLTDLAPGLTPLVSDIFSALDPTKVLPRRVDTVRCASGAGRPLLSLWERVG